MKPELMFLFAAFAVTALILFLYMAHLNRTHKRLEAELALLRRVDGAGRD